MRYSPPPRSAFDAGELQERQEACVGVEPGTAEAEVDTENSP